MSEDPAAGTAPGEPGAEDRASMLFASLVMQQANMALTFLGKVPHPESGKAGVDLEAARTFIDLLEMIETKTRGNLTAEEHGLLRDTLTTVRLAFVEVAEKGAPAGADAKPSEPKPEVAASPGASPGAAEAAAPPSDAETRKRFVKRY